MPAIPIDDKVVLAKIETTYGTDATPAAATDAIDLARTATCNFLEADFIDRGLLRGGLGASPQLVAGIRSRVNLECEAAGAGAAGTAPPYGTLLRMAGLAQAITAGTKVDYTPITTGYEAGSLYFHLSNIRQKLLGSRGGWSFTFNANDLPRFTFDFLGLFADPATVTPPDPTLTAWQTPLEVNEDNTTVCTFDSHAVVLEQLSISSGTTAVLKDRPNLKEVENNNRRITGSMTIRLPALADKNYFTAIKAGSLVPLAIQHGATAGHILEVTAPKVQIGQPTIGADGKTALITLPLTFTEHLGNDDVKFTVR